jgi:hypothetical protein
MSGACVLHELAFCIPGGVFFFIVAFSCWREREESVCDKEEREGRVNEKERESILLPHLFL